MNMNITYRRRQEVSILLILSMVFSLWAAVPQRVDAGFLQSVGKVLKGVVVTAGSLAGAAMGAVLGMAVGGGPIGMVAGGVGGFIVAKKLMGWATSSFVNVATVLGAVGGGLLMAGMGFPMLAIGVIGGGLIARGIAALIKKLTGKSAVLINKERLAVQEERSKSIIEQRLAESGAAAAAIAAPASTATVSSGEKTSEQVYDQYLAAYRAYMAATQTGDSKAAQQAYAEYQKYLTLYNQMLKSGN